MNIAHNASEAEDYAIEECDSSDFDSETGATTYNFCDGSVLIICDSQLNAYGSN